MGAYGRWWWLRSRRSTMCIISIVVLLIVYYCMGREHVLGHTSTRRERIITYIENTIQNALREEKGTGCDIPKLDPFAPEVTKFDKNPLPIVCKGTDWVYCKFNVCGVKETILKRETVITCVYKDIIYESDDKYHFGLSMVVEGADKYTLLASDHVEVSCTGRKVNRDLGIVTISKWEGLAVGYRGVKPKQAPPGRERTPNILILGFDSTSRNGFIRRMPESWRVLTDELDAITLNGYNIVGDGTPAAILPILTGYTELELPEVRKRFGSNGHLDTFPFLWYTLRSDGYRTAYFEDSPWIGTFQYRFTGFQNQPTDHYLRPFFMQYHYDRQKYSQGNNVYCIGDTPSHALMMNLTRQFMHLDTDSKKFIFTFIADITHDDFNFISNADDRLVQWLRDIKKDGILDNTLLIVMGDHGPRYASVRNTLQGKLEERLPLMSFVLPKTILESHPDALVNLAENANVLTTPFDIHSTLLDLVGLTDQRVTTKIKGSDLPRSMSLLNKIPSNRSCSEAGIEPHWCTCLKWQAVQPNDDMFQRSANALLDYINLLTQIVRKKCVRRTLTSIEMVSRRTPNNNLLTFLKNKDVDGYVGSFVAKMRISQHHYQVKIIVGPGIGIYEASMSYDSTTKKFHLTNLDISRINAYGDEPSCISATRPDLNMYCYCAKS